MGRATKGSVKTQQVRGLKYLRKLRSLLGRLHDDATARDKAGNRTLFYDQYAALVLMAMFSPAIDSLRAIRQASVMPKVGKLLGCSRASLGSLSEAARVFDPDLLLEVIAELSQELLPLAKDPRLKDVRSTLVLCDGTLLSALPRLAESMWKHSRSGRVMHAWRMHTQFELDRHVPGEVALTPYGAGDEPAVLLGKLRPGRCYVMDRGYFNYDLFNGIFGIGSDYVCRVKKTIGVLEVIAQREPTPEGRGAGVVKDQIVRVGSTPDKRADHPVRLVEVHAEVAPRTARGEGKPQAAAKTEVLLIATNLLDVPPEIIGLVYRYRWTIELFFRFFKQILGCRHLISDDPGGIAIQCYCAVIACLLLQLWTGKKPGKEMHRLISFYLCGWADEQDLINELGKPDNTGVKRAAKEALWKKLGV
jgi:hypothetical protein